MEQVTNTKRRYHFKRWTEITTDNDGENYNIKICSDKNAKKKGELCGREVLKEINLNQEEFRTLAQDLQCYEITKQKLRILATKYYNLSNLDKVLEGFKLGTEWLLNKDFERIPFIYTKGNNNTLNFKFNVSNAEYEQLRKLYHDFTDEYEFEVIIKKK